MPLRCNCGAILPEDARFCHKCGKPQYEEDIERLKAFEPEARPIAPPPPARHDSGVAGQPSHISLLNGRAVRISMAVAGLSLLAIALIASVVPPLLFPILVGAGFASVRIYCNRSSESMTPSGGAVLGAMTWMWLYVLEASCTAVIAFTPEGREVIKTLNKPELAQLLDDPSKLIPTLLVFLLVGTVSSALGGLMAVRWRPRNGPPIE